MRQRALCLLLLMIIGTGISGGAQAQTTPTQTPYVITATSVPMTQTPYIITATPIPATTVPTATTPQPDASEPNNALDRATWITMPGRIDKLNFYPAGDVDYFRFTVKASQQGLTLTVETFVDSGLDTVLRIFDANGVLKGENDDVSPSDPRSYLAGQLAPGDYVIEVSNRSNTKPDFKNYSLVLAVLPTGPQPTPTPEINAADQYKGINYTWENAAPIPIGETIKGLNFGCPSWENGRAGCFVPDFFTISIKVGVCYSVETLDLQPGIDTNVIGYSYRKDAEAPIAGNDDRGPGDFSSYIMFCAPYSGTVYVLIGQGTPPPPPIKERTYSLLARIWTPPAPTPTTQPTPRLAQSQGQGQGQTQYPTPESRPIGQTVQGAIIEEITLNQAAQPTAIPQILVPIGVLACYDRNQNQVCDVDEGIAGVAVYVARSDNGELVGQGITDQNGRAQMSVRVVETASLVISVPMFAASQTVNARSPQTRPIVIKTIAAIPGLIP